MQFDHHRPLFGAQGAVAGWLGIVKGPRSAPGVCPVADLDTAGIAGYPPQVGVDSRPVEVRGADIVEDRLVVAEGFAGTVFANFAEEPMFDGISFRSVTRAVKLHSSRSVLLSALLT